MSNDKGKTYKRYKHGTLNSVSSDTDTFVYDNPQEVTALERLQKLTSGTAQEVKNDIQTWTGYVLKALSTKENKDFSKHQKGKLRVPGDQAIRQFIVRIPEIHAAIPEPTNISIDPKKIEFEDSYVYLHDIFTIQDPNQPSPAPGDLVECDFRNRKNFTEGIIIDVYHPPNSFTGGILKAAGEAITSAKEAYAAALEYRESAMKTISDALFGDHDHTEDEDPILSAVKRSLVPTANRISSMPQKNRKDPVAGKRSKSHDGMDIAVNAKRNQPIINPQPGIVKVSKYNKFNGNYVVIEHAGGLKSYFLHLQESSTLKVGDKVEKGDLVGIVGNTGRSAGIHLHYAIKRQGQWTLPQEILIKEWKV